MNDSGEENNYISGNSEIISSKNVSSRGLLHPLRGSPLPEGAKVTTTPEEPNTPTKPNLKHSNISLLLYHTPAKMQTKFSPRVAIDKGGRACYTKSIPMKPRSSPCGTCFSSLPRFLR